MCAGLEEGASHREEIWVFSDKVNSKCKGHEMRNNCVVFFWNVRKTGGPGTWRTKRKMICDELGE